jgi:hypothetical protein
MLYVCPHFDRMPPRMSQHARLYAFPARPEPGDFVLLDSGAYGLSQRGRQIGPAHMRRLAEYYRPYAGQTGYCCIAPDVYLDPARTRHNWLWWQEHIGLPVAPVIQFPAAGRIDVYAGLKQAEFYAAWQPDVMSISNPALRATASTANELLAAEVRHITGCRWLHNLGAGWSPADIADWRDLACFDSIDSVAYYTDAQRGVRWRLDGRTERSAAPWRQIAVENAGVAAQIAGSTAFGGRY